jgi:class 3 adenylate cyclase/tetratricopeptide (TPR) repeat protein
MLCLNCGTDNPVDAAFCEQCGHKLERLCPACRAPVSADAKFCRKCGTSLSAAPVGAETVGTSPSSQAGIRLLAEQSVADVTDGERKTVTALFADLTSSTAMLEKLDPEEGRAIVEPLIRIMSEAVRRYEGYLVRTTGDGIFALFGAPVAYEDHPQRALYAALQMQQKLRAQVQAQAEKGQPALEARVGVHTGEVVAYAGEASGKIEYRLIGHTANLASRMESIAPPGSIAVSETTAKLCDGYFELRNLGPATVKGVSAPVSVYEVLGPGPLRTHFELSARRGLTRFVGRERELGQMRRALDQTIDGHGQIVAAVAEAGTGKSRLFYEFKVTIPASCKVLEAYSVSHGKASAWLPVLELLHGYFDITESDDAASRRDKVRAALTALDPALDDTLPYLFGLMGIVDGPDPYAQMDARIRRQRTLDAIKRFILRDSLRQPIVIIFEDLHWIDEQTQALLDLLVDSVASARMLLLFNYRPEYHHGWANKSYYSQLRLEPLAGADGAAMLSALLGEGGELSPLKRLIAERTGGNPFFIEEIVQGLFEDGALVRNGTLRITRSLSQLRLPPTVQGMLAARIDRLPRLQKDLLQTLAVIGREARLRLVRQVTSTEEVLLSQNLAELCAAEFIHEQPIAGDTEFVFKHALTQEVAYNSVLMERRKVLHERAAQALEGLFVNSTDEHLVDLSYHYSSSGNDSKAIDYLIRAGWQAQQRSAYALAARHLEQALTRLSDQPASTERDRKEIAIRAGLADSAEVMSGYAAPEYESQLIRRHELAQRLGDTTQIFYSLVGMSVLSAFRLELNKAQNINSELLAISFHEHDPGMQLQAHGSLANTLWLLGDFIGSLEQAEKGIALYAREQRLTAGDEHMRSACRLFAGLSTAALGFPDKALRQGLEFLASARESGQLLPLVFALNCLSTIFEWRGEGAEALKCADELAALVAEQGMSYWRLINQINHGHTLALLGRANEGIAEIKPALDSLETAGAAIPGWASACLGFGYSAANQSDEGMKVTVNALEIAGHTGDSEAKPELHRLYGQLLLMRYPKKADEAETSFRAAIDVARSQCAKSAELRATTSLARLLASQGRHDEARTILAEIYNWFTEGLDTADLKGAKALLDELRNSAKS